ncbi:MAG: hydrogenase formation protein HypD [Desulfonatronovibrionaceae bacterium]
MNLFDKLSDPELCRSVLDRIRGKVGERLKFMEVCGTHTVAIFQSGIRSVLPENVTHLSGPGCPVCVTHESEVAAFLELAGQDAVVATFGDLMRVPGPGGMDLKKAQAEGARINVVYSPFDALELARKNPTERVVFLGVGFETTAPTVAATLNLAREQGVDNFFVLSFHKLVPPALRALVQDGEVELDALLLPGHVSTITGRQPYEFLAREYGIPSVIGGFDPLDILRAVLEMAEQLEQGRAEVVNCYKRAVGDEGNPNARKMMDKVFCVQDSQWRGLGTIPQSGLGLNDSFAAFDAEKEFELEMKDVSPLPGCRCGEVLKGLICPDECPLFSKVCTPAKPVGPCMVSTEGSCAAYFKYSLGP